MGPKPFLVLVFSDFVGSAELAACMLAEEP